MTLHIQSSSLFVQKINYAVFLPIKFICDIYIYSHITADNSKKNSIDINRDHV